MNDQEILLIFTGWLIGILTCLLIDAVSYALNKKNKLKEPNNTQNDSFKLIGELFILIGQIKEIIKKLK